MGWRSRFSTVSLLLLSVLGVPGGIDGDAGPSSIGSIPVPLDECALLQKAFENLVHPSDHCLFVSMDHIKCPLVVNNCTTFVISLDQMFSGLVNKLQGLFACDKVLAFLEDFSTFRYYIRNKDLQSVLQPFTRIVIFTLKNEAALGLEEKEHYNREILHNGLFMNVAGIVNETHYRVEDGLTQEGFVFRNIRELDKYIEKRRHYSHHPLFNLKDREFNVSLFHCPPNVIKLDDKLTMDSYDGTEFQFLKEIMRGWKVNIFDRTFLFDKDDTYEVVATDVQKRRTMMGMCSMWMNIDRYRQLLLSDHFSYLCGTFLVPKPHPLTQASIIYLPLSPSVWLFILATLLATTLLYFLLYRKVSHEPQMEILSRSVMDIINIVTSHGLPKVVQRIPLRLLIISWILLSLLLGTAYTTKYTSILTKPMYSKPVDDIKDFLDEGLFWGELGERTSWVEYFLRSGNSYYMELGKRIRVEKTLEERLEYIPTGRYARYVKVLGNNYVTDTETFPTMAYHLRLMRTCVDNFYTVFPFYKNSPYKRYVDGKMSRFRDAGIIEHWFSLMTTKYGEKYMEGFFDKNVAKRKTEAVPLKLENVVGAFYLLGIGLGLAAVVFIIELLNNKRSR